jgi:hypothetical protein
LVARIAAALERTVTAEPFAEAMVNRWGVVDDSAALAESGTAGMAYPSWDYAEDLETRDAPSDAGGIFDSAPPSPRDEPFAPRWIPDDESGAVAQPPPFRSTGPVEADELTTLGVLADELALDPNELRQLCRKLSVAPAGADETVSIAQADLLRQRVRG